MTKILILGIFGFVLLPFASFAQKLTNERELYQRVLKNLKKDVKENYYDPNLRGIDLDALVKKASDLVAVAKSIEEMTDIVARVLIQFEDSHLAFIPPPKTISVDYGWYIQLIGDKVFVIDVEDDSDAKKKGIQPGDQIYMLDGFIPTRKEFWLLKYHYEVLAPRPRLSVVIIKPSGKKYKVEIEAKVVRESIFIPETRELKLQYDREFLERTRQGFYDAIPGLSIWKIPSFEFSDIKVNKMMSRVNKSPALILDLRGNGGGLFYSLEELVNAFFNRDVTIGEIHSRRKTEVSVLKGDGKKAFTGNLVVLIDSESSSAAEIFARIVQLEKRGLVFGDQSSGRVMLSVVITHSYGLDSEIGYGFSITIADLIMKDGQRLEKIGVTPDEMVLATAMDLAKQRDPVLSRAAKSLGFQLTPEAAGKIFEKKK
jgi:C-terminal processing protease CtpA/Prc